LIDSLQRYTIEVSDFSFDEPDEKERMTGVRGGLLQPALFHIR
jgi:hypothetical protein